MMMHARCTVYVAYCAVRFCIAPAQVTARLGHARKKPVKHSDGTVHRPRMQYPLWPHVLRNERAWRQGLTIKRPACPLSTPSARLVFRSARLIVRQTAKRAHLVAPLEAPAIGVARHCQAMLHSKLAEWRAVGIGYE
jgi:hypothetical protein